MNDKSAHLHFLIISPHPSFNLFQEYNSKTIRNISMILILLFFVHAAVGKPGFPGISMFLVYYCTDNRYISHPESCASQNKVFSPFR